ncbi:Neutral zinc metallopeptidase [Phytophthora palmivora]|uniref:Neutral zinc metallopeptidase n=1 Tax=Phytophthora palmivora TaxID=4796 RepID=A0A2P4XEI4_9STRA|nr:Neutral zinc metallopeptidase [Phytophthora palmivora]
MATRPAFCNPAKTVLTVALLALAVTSSVTSGAKCYPKTPASVPSVTPAPDIVEETPSTSFGSQETDLPTQSSTEAPTTESSSFEAPTTESSSFETPATESSSFETPATQSSSDEDAGQNPAEGSTESSDVSQGSSTETQGSSTEQTGNSTSTSTGEHATFGKITSSSGACVTGDPETFVTREDVDWVWKNNMAEYVPQFKNLIFDQLVTNKGKLQYCVRWDNDKKLEKAVASKFQDMLTKQMDLWNQWLAGYECWPFDKIDIEIVAFAVKDKSIMDWSDDSLGTIYEGILDAEGSSPKCPDECYKHQGQAASADTSGCKGKPFDMSLWPSTKPGDGAIGTGGDWGQRVEVNDMLATMDQDHMMVLLHEIGHGFGLPEYGPGSHDGYPACVMDNDLKLTDGDGWLLRVVLENIKSRYSFSK